MITSFIFGMSVFGSLADTAPPIQDQVTINFTGEIIAPPCTVDTTKVKQPITFDIVSPEFLNNGYSKDKPVEIDFTCSTNGYKNITLQFMGNTVASNSELLTDTGTNVVVKLKEKQGKDITFNKDMDSTQFTNGKFKLEFIASIHKSTDSSVGAVQAGTFKGITNVVIKYS
ncbi:fimbrial protein [Xenorhabdus santafensis]|nr:fimbrial protein [Xenorhabdus sp. 12]